MKKRINGEGSISRRKNGTFEGRVTVGFDPSSGKQIRKSIYGRTLKEVREKMAEIQKQYANATTTEEIEAVGMSLGEWLETWLVEYVQDVKPGTKTSYASIVDNHIRPALGKIALQDLKPPMIQKFYNQLRNNGLSAKYIKNIHGVLHRALDVAVKIEFIEKNYTSVCSLPKGESQEIHPLDAPQQRKLLNALKGEEYEDLILTDMFTGLRCGELIGLTWDCIDFDKGTIHVKKQLVQTRNKGEKYAFGSPKNGKSRVIQPASYVIQVLKRHKTRQAEMRLAAGELWNDGGFPNLVFTHKDGSNLSQPTIWKEFQKVLKKAGLDHHRFHDLRHTYAVNSLMAGDDIKTLQENLGHYSAAFTLDRYGHVTESMRKASSDRMQRFIEAL